MRNYVREQTSTLLRRLAYQITQTVANADADAIHDLRVAIRRLNRCLQVFAGFFPSSSGKKIRRKLHRMMDGAGEVRDRDIAVGLLREAGVAPDAAAFRVLQQERAHAAELLSAILEDWKQDSLSRRWRRELGL